MLSLSTHRQTHHTIITMFKLSLLTLLSTSAVVVAVPDPCPPDFEAKDIDLSGFAHGDYIATNQDLGGGVTVSVVVQGTTDRRARIYDTDITGGEDPDLEVDLGPCLIMQDVSTTEPSDNAFGGNMRFRFPQPIFADEMTIVDADEQGDTIFYKKGVANMGNTDIPQIGDGQSEVVQMDKAGVDLIRVKFVGSGAICELKYCVSFCPPGSSLQKVDFEADVNGPLSHGDYVSDFPFFSVVVNRNTDARIYDSDITGGADDDLEVGVGNLLIIQEPGVVEPNDKLDGGNVNFMFNFPTKVKSMGFVDIEAESALLTKVLTFDAANNKEQSVVPPMGDKVFFEYELPGELNQPGGIEKLRVRMGGSGGIAYLNMCVPDCPGC